MQLMVETRNLRKTYNLPDGSNLEAVKGVDLEIRRGEIFSLLGPNGAGKTTTISMISGLVDPSEGDATIGGYSIINEPIAAKRLMGFVPQEIALYPELSARQNLVFFGRMYGLGGKELGRRVDELLEFVDLVDRQKDRIATYSGGMKRRINLAAGLLNNPPLVFMDEPTVGIDPQSRRRILDTVKMLRDEQNMTVLYTTHLMEEAQELSDRVGIIDHGEIIALGTQDELTQQVGEEDRLEMTIGAHETNEALINQIQQENAGVSRILFNPSQEGSEDSTESTPARLTVFAKRGRTALPKILQDLNSAGVEIQSIAVNEPDLEAVFLALTGRALRD